MGAKSLNDMTAKQAARAVIHTLLTGIDSAADLKESYPTASSNQLAQVAKFFEADVNRIITRYGYDPVILRENLS